MGLGYAARIGFQSSLNATLGGRLGLHAQGASNHKACLPIRRYGQYLADRDVRDYVLDCMSPYMTAFRS